MCYISLLIKFILTLLKLINEIMNDTKEIFRDVEGYEGFYQVSNFGRVKSLSRTRKGQKNTVTVVNEILLKTGVDSYGYPKVGFSKEGEAKTFRVHKLVAIYFLNHIPNGYKLVVNHIDFDKTNNNVNNLEIVSQRENANQKHIKSSSKYTGVCWAKPNKKWRSRIRINGKIKNLGYFTNELDASNAYQNALAELSN